MKITIVADVFGEENNGTTITIKRLIDGLVARGHHVKIVSPLLAENTSMVEYFTVPKRSFGIFNSYVSKNGVELGKPSKEIIKKAIQGSDVVHVVLPFKMGKMAVKICKELKKPITAAFHCQPENFSSHLGLKNSRLFNNMIHNYYRNKFYKYIGYIHCPTEFIANELEKHKYKAKKFAISNGVIPTYKKFEAKKPKELKDKFIILFVARLSKEKRHDLLIKAIPYSKYADRVQLIFAGRGPLEDKLKKIGKRLKNKVVIGFYPKEELSKIINFSDLYVHPSDVEIEAISCIEAMTCGLVPVISNSKKSATRFFALCENNLFEAGSPKDLARKIDYWIEHQEEKNEMSNRYVDYAKQFNIENSIDQMISMFNEAVNDYKLLK
ncbi:MAG: glycosyltransferase [Clostridia bacterium]|nr:glycosyltransferase [Clostridia bacterium]